MKVFWWETGIQIEPESQVETDALKALYRVLWPSKEEWKKVGSGSVASSSENDGLKLVVPDK